ncbi:MAG: hypothetical protein KIS66_04860 [Fimbriimonadaceae bacterium]|nr:hypothetical protein [Fimbriimonadaceae bacterium]
MKALAGRAKDRDDLDAVLARCSLPERQEALEITRALGVLLESDEPAERLRRALDSIGDPNA